MNNARVRSGKLYHLAEQRLVERRSPTGPLAHSSLAAQDADRRAICLPETVSDQTVESAPNPSGTLSAQVDALVIGEAFQNTKTGQIEVAGHEDHEKTSITQNRRPK